MPLVLPDLQNELIDVYDKGKKGNPEPTLVGLKTGTAYAKYVSGGMNAAGFPFTSMPGTMDLQDGIGDLLNKKGQMGTSFAASLSMKVNDCLMTFLSVHQTSIITAAGTATLFQELNDIFSKPMPDSTSFAMALGRALHNFTLAATVIGVVPDTPGVPFAGPIS
jgi:hypothetical protein